VPKKPRTKPQRLYCDQISLQESAFVSQTIRVGIVGAGANTRAMHLPNLQKIEGVEIVGVVNRSRESSERVARQFGIPKIYQHWREAINDSETNAIVVGTWPYLHAPVTIAALDAGKHVLCEARMAMNAAEAHTMRAAAAASPQLIAQIVPAPMTLGIDGTIQRLLSEGFIGRVLVVEVRASSGFLNREAPLHWRQNTELSGCNIMSLGIWYEAVMRWIGHATHVTAMGKTFVKLRPDAEGVLRSVRVPEHVDVLAEMECGAQLHMQISAVCGLAPGNGAWLFGDEGTLHFDGRKLRGARRGEKELREIEVPAEENSQWRVEEEWIGAIRGEEPVKLTDFATGVKYMEFIEAACRSTINGQTVSLPLCTND
jgi:predicted dehydrogenase